MSLKVKDFSKIIELLAPSYLSESYDNVGLMVGDTEEVIDNILVAMDCTLDVIDEAMNKKCNLIFTHHPLLFIKPKSITNETLKGKKILKLIKNDISLYSAHTNLDSAHNGINDYAAEIIGYDSIEVIDKSIHYSEDNKSGIGRVLTFKEGITLRELCERIKILYNATTLRYSGKDDKVLTKVAVINGSGQDYISVSRKLGAECIITGDTTYHFVSDYEEEGLCIIDAGHFDTEWPAFKMVAKNIEEELREQGFSGEIKFSEVCKNPYKTL